MICEILQEIFDKWNLKIVAVMSIMMSASTDNFQKILWNK